MTGPGNSTLREVPQISLTFDDGTDPVWMPHVLEALQWAEAQATFFVIAPLGRRFPHLVSDVLRAGHGVVYQCTQHVQHTERTRREVEGDARADLRTFQAWDVSPRFWRHLWGVLAPFTAEIADKLGLRIIPWSKGTRDWRGDPAPRCSNAWDPSSGRGRPDARWDWTQRPPLRLRRNSRSRGWPPGTYSLPWLRARTLSHNPGRTLHGGDTLPEQSNFRAGKTGGKVRTESSNWSRETSLLTMDLNNVVAEISSGARTMTSSLGLPRGTLPGAYGGQYPEASGNEPGTRRPMLGLLHRSGRSERLSPRDRRRVCA